jgi:hypothetical protein
MITIVLNALRYVFAIFIISKVYQETGVYTGICMGLIFIAFELVGLYLKNMTLEIRIKK